MKQKIVYEMTFEEVAEKFGISSNLDNIQIVNGKVQFEFIPPQKVMTFGAGIEGGYPAQIPVPSGPFMNPTKEEVEKMCTGINPTTPADIEEDSELGTFKIRGKTKKAMVDDKLLEEVKEIKNKVHR